MTNEELLSVAEIVERATNRFNEQAARFRERSAAYDRLIADMNADHEAKMADHRASFGARTEADAKLIEGLRTENERLQKRIVISEAEIRRIDELVNHDREDSTADKVSEVVKERDGLLTQVQDQRAEIERLRNDERKAYQDGEALRAEVADLRGIVDMVHASLGIKRGDHIGKAIEALKSQSTPTTKQHPVKVGEYVKDDNGDVCQVHEVYAEYLLNTGWTWAFENCTPCDPPVDHDTPAGKAVAEAVVQDERCGEIAVGDMIEGLFDDTKITVRREPDQNHGSRIVISDANDMGEANIYLTESGARQMATALIGLCDVRKVPQ